MTEHYCSYFNPCTRCIRDLEMKECQICDDKCYYKHVEYDGKMIRGNYVHTCSDCGHRAHWLCSQKLSNENPLVKMNTTKITCTNCMTHMLRNEKIRKMNLKPNETAFKYDTKQFISQIDATLSSTYHRVKMVENMFEYFVSHKNEFNSDFDENIKTILYLKLEDFHTLWQPTNTIYFKDELFK